ncbi:hypothetical protein [Methanosarcina horonobensis]|uniref:hypothetical protein n=1 Tax=Methanosarcina horonobensis TaxID=418008 RepID=UPI000B270E60|nr:hypothetical protein [Methanosarcina horonobensis]
MIALAEHFVREEQREKEKKMAELYFVLIQHKEARELLKEVSRTPKKSRSTYKGRYSPG